MLNDEDREILRAVDEHYFDNDPYNLKKDQMFFETASALIIKNAKSTSNSERSS